MVGGRWFGAMVVMAASVVWSAAPKAPGAAAAKDGDWPGWRGPKRDGMSTETGLLKEWPAGGPKQLWKATGIGKGFSTVAIANGVLYTTGDIGDSLVISAFDTSGKKLWPAPAGTSRPTLRGIPATWSATTAATF